MSFFFLSKIIFFSSLSPSSRSFHSLSQTFLSVCLSLSIDLPWPFTLRIPPRSACRRVYVVKSCAIVHETTAYKLPWALGARAVSAVLCPPFCGWKILVFDLSFFNPGKSGSVLPSLWPFAETALVRTPYRQKKFVFPSRSKFETGLPRTTIASIQQARPVDESSSPQLITRDLAPRLVHGRIVTHTRLSFPLRLFNR